MNTTIIAIMKLGSYFCLFASAFGAVANWGEGWIVAVSVFWGFYAYWVLRLINILENVAAWYQEYERNIKDNQ